MCFLVGVSIYGYSNGNLEEIMAPVDGQGRICGFSEGVENTPYLWVSYYADIKQFDTYLFESGVCTTSCPTTSTGDGASIGCVNTVYTSSTHPCETQPLYPTIDIVSYCAVTQDTLSPSDYDLMVKNFED
jgi:hypothetical protein